MGTNSNTHDNIMLDLGVGIAVQQVEAECNYTFIEGRPALDDEPEQRPDIILNYVWIRYDGRNRVDIMGILSSDVRLAICEELVEYELEQRGI